MFYNKSKVLVFLMILALAFQVEGATRVVNQTGPACTSGASYNTTIQDAINISLDGDEIVICAGLYVESITVNKGVRIRAYNTTYDVVVNSSSNLSDAVTIVANYVSISWLRVQNASAYGRSGINISFSSFGNFSYNILTSNSGGIHLYYSTYNNITNNIAEDNGVGIYLESSDNNFIGDNNASGNFWGIGLRSSNDNTLQDNTVKQNAGAGIYLELSDNNTIENNIANGNGYHVWYESPSGIHFHSSQYNTLRNNTAINNNKYDLNFTSTSTSNTAYNNTACKINDEDANTIINTTCTTDSTAPLYRYQGSNVTRIYQGGATLLHAQGWDNVALSYAFLSTNETGIWQNWSKYGSPVEMGRYAVKWLWSNFTWQNDSLGTIGWRVWYNDTAGNWNVTDILTFQVWGRSNVTWIYPPRYNVFLRGMDVELQCMVRNIYDLSPISNYPVKFYNNTTFLGENLTNSSGIAVWYWNTTGMKEGTYKARCKISDNATLYYNVSGNEANASITLEPVPIRSELGTMQPTKSITVEPGKNYTTKLYFFNTLGDKATHINLSVRNAPSGWKVSFEPPSHEITTVAYGEWVTYEENVCANPPNLTPCSGPPGNVVDEIPNETYEGVEYIIDTGDGYIPSKVVNVTISVPEDAPYGEEFSLSITARAFWLEIPSYIIKMEQIRDFNYAIETIPPPIICGNGICQEGETCSSCPADCGTCPVSRGRGRTSISPAYFSLSNLTITPATAKINQTVMIKVDVKNTGGIPGTKVIKLKINGEEIASKTLTLGVGEEEEISFNVSRSVPGRYRIAVGYLTGSFTVVEPTTPAPTPLPITIPPAPNPLPIQTPVPTPTPTPQKSFWKVPGFEVISVILGFLIVYLVRKKF